MPSRPRFAVVVPVDDPRLGDGALADVGAEFVVGPGTLPHLWTLSEQLARPPVAIPAVDVVGGDVQT